MAPPLGSNTNDRLGALKAWVADVIASADYEIRPASEDASFRRYFRITVPGRSFIVMDAPPDKEDTRPFVRIAERLLGLGLNVPEVFEHDPEAGFVLLGDLGDQTYLRHLNPDTVERLYGDALGSLIVLQTGTFSDPDFLPPYDHALLTREMELFREWYLERHLELKLSAADHAVLDRAFAALAQSALAQPRVWVHRDYHSRNLMLTRRNNPGILDFQDAVSGPVTYDLVSLLRDCYIAWPRALVEDWVKGYHELALQSGLPVGEDENEFLRWFDRMGVQRHLKATGIFARLHHRDGKPGFLRDIPRVLDYILAVSARCPELGALHEMLDRLPRRV